MVHDRGPAVSKRVRSANRARGKTNGTRPVNRISAIRAAKAGNIFRLLVKHAATANINPDNQASVCLIVMWLAVEKQFHLGERRLMTFPEYPGGQMPKEVTTWAVQIAPQERCATFAMCGEFINPASTLAALTRVRMQASKNRMGIAFAGMVACRIDAGKEGRKSTKEHV